VNIIDQCVAQGVPFAREYGGLLDNRSFGGAQVSRTFYARGQTGQQLLLGAYQALMRQVRRARSSCTPAPRCSTCGRRTAGPRHRRARPGHRRDHLALGPRGGAGHRRLRQRLLPVDQRQGSNVTAAWRAHRKGALFANPCFTQIHPTCIPASDEFQSKLTLMSESLRNDGRIWVPKDPDDRPARRTRSPRRTRLLPRAQVPGVRQPGAARRRLARAKDAWSTRAGASARSRTASTSTSPTPSPARRGRHRGALRQPVRDVRAHHRRGPLRGADAHLPRRPLHDGRAVGRLQPDDDDPRPVRARRGQLLRPRRQPPRRLGAHAGPRRRLLRPAVHDRRLPRRPARRPGAGDDRPPRLRRGRGRGPRDRIERLLSVKGTRSRSTGSTASSARSCGTLRHGPQRRPGSRRRCRRSRPCARSSGATCGCSATARRSTVAREGRPGRRLLRARRADVPRRPRPRGVLRRPLPRGAPDRGGRGAARRRELRLRRRLGVDRGPGEQRAHLHKEPLEFETSS
jgi:hypothetical protein